MPPIFERLAQRQTHKYVSQVDSTQDGVHRFDNAWIRFDIIRPLRTRIEEVIECQGPMPGKVPSKLNHVGLDNRMIYAEMGA